VTMSSAANAINLCRRMRAPSRSAIGMEDEYGKRLFGCRDRRITAMSWVHNKLHCSELLRATLLYMVTVAMVFWADARTAVCPSTLLTGHVKRTDHRFRAE
jgi:hypothetical protein